MVVASFTLSVTFPTTAVSQTPSIVSIGHAINGTSNTRQIIRTSSGRIYYFTGDQAYAGPSSGAVEVHTSEFPGKKIVVEPPIRRLGEHKVQVRLHADITADITVEVVAE